MNRLAVEHLEFWVALVGGAATQIAYFAQLRKWRFMSSVMLMFGLITIPWLILGLRGRPIADNLHVVFFGAVAVLMVVMAVGFAVLAVRALRHRKDHRDASTR